MSTGRVKTGLMCYESDLVFSVISSDCCMHSSPKVHFIVTKGKGFIIVD